ncbi:MAG TPA: DUF2218 domain-containing protein [Novosphingobium sp.]|nr:DUF2218 domain-containing protein [Novosphingobium sp.]
MPLSQAIVPTASASRYMQQLAKHWSHKFPVSFDATRASFPLPLGPVTMLADAAALTVTCEVAEGGDIERLQQVVAEHLNRFAFREGELVFDWQPA